MAPPGESAIQRSKARFVLASLVLVTVSSALATRWQAPREILWIVVPLLALLQWTWFRQSAGPEPRRQKHVTEMTLAALAAHVIFVIAGDPLYTSDDINRYVFEGHVVASGGNPYTHAPASPVFDQLAEDSTVAEIRRGVNNDRIATIYPPAAEALFALGTFLHPGRLGWLLLILFFDAILLWALPRLLASHDLDPRWSVAYAFHPIVIFEGLGGGHVDLVAVSFLVCAFFAATTRRRYAAWVLYALSVLTKVVSLLAGFALLKRSGWAGMIVAAVLVIGSILLCFAGQDAAPRLEPGIWRTIDSRHVNEKGLAFEIIGKAALRSLLKMEEEALLSSAGNTAVITAGSSRALIQRADVKQAARLEWSDMVGQFRLVGFRGAAEKWDGLVIRLDGQGRIFGEAGDEAVEGRYWIEEERFLAVQLQGEMLPLLTFTEDLQTGSADGCHLIKREEKAGMGFRHYGGRWTANAPVFSLLESWMPAPDEYDHKRKFAQRLVAVILLLAALAFVCTSWSLPKSGLWLFTLLWLTAPAVYPWYLLWMIPFLGFSRSLTPLVFTYTGMAMHLTPESFSSDYLVYSPVALAAVVDALHFVKSRGKAS